MAKLNVPITADTYDGPLTHEGAQARRLGAAETLRRSVMACLLWEDQFYEDGEGIAERISELASKVPIATLASLAIEAREQMHLRHVPLLLCKLLAKHHAGSHSVGDTIRRVIQRADELAEFLTIYWREKRCPLSAQVKRGLASAFTKFNAYELAKYNRPGAVKLRDVLFLCHAKPKDKAQEATWKQLIEGKLPTPDTWEVELSAGKDKRETFTRLLQEGKLGYLALLRNLRNMETAGVDHALVSQAILARKGSADRVLPFRFIAAAKAAPCFEDALDQAMTANLAQAPRLPGKTVVIIDVSGSMYNTKLSDKSDMDRALAACSLGAILREACEQPVIYATAGDDGTRIHKTALVPARRGMALVDAIYQMCNPLGGGGIFLKQVMDFVLEREREANQIVVITDEQDCGIADKDNPTLARAFGETNFLINVGSYNNGIGYGKWVHIDGWSEAIVRFIQYACGATSARALPPTGSRNRFTFITA